MKGHMTRSASVVAVRTDLHNVRKARARVGSARDAALSGALPVHVRAIASEQ